MCGRYSVLAEKRKGNSIGRGSVAEILLKYKEEACFNAAPSQLLPVITNSERETV